MLYARALGRAWHRQELRGEMRSLRKRLERLDATQESKPENAGMLLSRVNMATGHDMLGIDSQPVANNVREVQPPPPPPRNQQQQQQSMAVAKVDVPQPSLLATPIAVDPGSHVTRSSSDKPTEAAGSAQHPSDKGLKGGGESTVVAGARGNRWSASGATPSVHEANAAPRANAALSAAASANAGVTASNAITTRSSRSLSAVNVEATAKATAANAGKNKANGQKAKKNVSQKLESAYELFEEALSLAERLSAASRTKPTNSTEADSATSQLAPTVESDRARDVFYMLKQLKNHVHQAAALGAIVSKKTDVEIVCHAIKCLESERKSLETLGTDVPAKVQAMVHRPKIRRNQLVRKLTLEINMTVASAYAVMGVITEIP